MKGTKDLDDVIRDIMGMKGLTKSQASDFVAFEIKKIMGENKKKGEKGIELRFF